MDPGFRRESDINGRGWSCVVAGGRLLRRTRRAKPERETDSIYPLW